MREAVEQDSQYQLHLEAPLPPVSRKRDPGTSQRAEEQITWSGARTSQMGWVLRAVWVLLRPTAPEIAAWCTANGRRLDRVQVNRRTADLERLGLLQHADFGGSDCCWGLTEVGMTTVIGWVQDERDG